MKALIAIFFCLIVSAAQAATATLSWPTVKTCNISSATSDATGNIVFQCSSSLKMGVNIQAALNESDPTMPVIVNGSCTYTRLSVFRSNFGKDAFISADCAPAQAW